VSIHLVPGGQFFAREGKEQMRGLSLLLVATMVGGMTPVIFGQSDASAPAQSATQTSKAAKKAAVAPPTDAEIADAKAKGEVWVNTNTKVYHKADDAQYAKTRHGKFMSEADAQTAGYRQAKASPVGKKKGATASSAAPQQ
jgi:hypothetical protein